MVSVGRSKPADRGALYVNPDSAADLFLQAAQTDWQISADCTGDAALDQLLGEARGLLDRVRPQIAEQAFHLALETIWRVVGEANRYVDEQAPWSLRKTDMARLGTVLYVLAEVIRHLAILAHPVVPADWRAA